MGDQREHASTRDPGSTRSERGNSAIARPAVDAWTRELAGLASRSPGLGRLPPTLASGIARLSGFAMDDVQVRYGSPEPARMAAHAFARGKTIHVGPGQERHLPHEAWHVVQQAQGRVQATRQLHGVGMSGDRALEREADRMGALAVSGSLGPAPTQLSRITTPSDAPVQRKVGFEFQCRNLKCYEVKKNNQTKLTTETEYKPSKGLAGAMKESTDGWYLTSDGGDPEFVVEPPIEEGDATALDKAMKSLVRFGGGLGKGDYPMIHKTKQFKIKGIENPVTADPQITAGIAYERLGELFQLLSNRDPKTGPVSEANKHLTHNKAVKHYKGDDLLLAKARNDVLDAMTYDPAHTFFTTLFPIASDLDQVVGVLSLMASYIRKGAELGHAYIKDFPLLAKTDMATIVWNSPLSRVPINDDDIDNVMVVVMGNRKNTREQIYDSTKLDSQQPAEDGPTIDEWVSTLFKHKKDLLSYRHNRDFADNSMGGLNRLDQVGTGQNVPAPILEFRRINDTMPVTDWHAFATRVLTWVTAMHANFGAAAPDF